MARDHARVNLDIWNDPEFRALPSAAQHLYLILWTHPDLSYCGTLDWRPARLVGLAADLDKQAITTAGDCLQARHFIVIDEETEEVLIRSWIRFDGIMKQPRMAISCVTAYGAVGSNKLRSVVVSELRKVRQAHPELSCWGDDRVARVLEHPAVSAKDLPVPEDPFGDGFTHRFTHRVTPSVTHGVTPSLDETRGKGNPSVYPSVYTPPTTATATATATTTYGRTLDASAPELDELVDPDHQNTQTLVAEWIDHCRQPPPRRVIGQIAKEIKTMLDEGIPYADVRAGLAAWQRKAINPSALASVVHEIRNPRQPVKPTTDDRVREGLELAAQLERNFLPTPRIGA